MNIELGNLAVAVVICVIFGRRWHRLVPAGPQERVLEPLTSCAGIRV
jgi:hypothetical protein